MPSQARSVNEKRKLLDRIKELWFKIENAIPYIIIGAGGYGAVANNQQVFNSTAALLLIYLFGKSLEKELRKKGEKAEALEKIESLARENLEKQGIKIEELEYKRKK